MAKPTSFRLSPHALNELERQAKALGVTKSKAIEIAILGQLPSPNRNSSSIELARHLLMTCRVLGQILLLRLPPTATVEVLDLLRKTRNLLASLEKSNDNLAVDGIEAIDFSIGDFGLFPDRGDDQ